MIVLTKQTMGMYVCIRYNARFNGHFWRKSGAALAALLLTAMICNIIEYGSTLYVVMARKKIVANANILWQASCQNSN